MSYLLASTKPGETAYCMNCWHKFPQDPWFEVECPTCGAPPGQYCRRPSGHQGPLIGIHKERDLAAFRQGYYNHNGRDGKPCGPQSTDKSAEQLALSL